MRHRLLISVLSLLAASVCAGLAFMGHAGDVKDGDLAQYSVSARAPDSTVSLLSGRWIRLPVRF